ncbi:MAG: aspartate aminotransferase family protein [Bifidobacteriaceae bacterium]|nr:aspartate aminotransferase family protein [Bifidobacteriaceae bacterium]
MTIVSERARESRPLSSIMEGNCFARRDLGQLPASDQALIARREGALANCYRLFYRHPLRVAAGSGCHITDHQGNRYLDAYNNVASVGHANPAVAAAVARQLALINSHTRYLHEGIVDYAEQLLATFPAELDKVIFTNSGSESNDLAVRIAKLATGGDGVVVTAEAYHGTTDLLARLSPALGGGFVRDPAVRLVEPPDPYRQPAADLSAAFGERVAAAFADLLDCGIRPAALLVDSIMSSDGIFPQPIGTVAAAAGAARAAGALVICDEVQPGFGRMGQGWWGFARHGLVPDLVTLGKPMGNGIPVAAVVGRAEAVDAFGRQVAYFNTFGGNPVAIAAAQAVLDFIADNDLIAHAGSVGRRLRAGLDRLAGRHGMIGDVRGAGLYYGLEIVADKTTRQPDSATALAIVNGLRDRLVLISVCGPNNNVLKIRPPLVFGNADADELFSAFDAVLNAQPRPPA